MLRKAEYCIIVFRGSRMTSFRQSAGRDNADRRFATDSADTDEAVPTLVTVRNLLGLLVEEAV